MLDALLKKWKVWRRPLPRTGPRIDCERVLLGSDYGGYTVCPTDLHAGSVVYSFGVGCDVTFDQALIARYGLTIHAFDPTPKSIEWVRSQALPPTFVFHEFGIADYDGTADFHPPKNPAHVSHSVLPGRTEKSASAETLVVPVARLSTILERLGHTELDVLKLDIEGAEYKVITDILGSGIPIRQILIEFHHRHPGIGLASTERAIAELERAGFRFFHMDESGQEFSFLNTAPRRA